MSGTRQCAFVINGMPGTGKCTFIKGNGKYTLILSGMPGTGKCAFVIDEMSGTGKCTFHYRWEVHVHYGLDVTNH